MPLMFTPSDPDLPIVGVVYRDGRPTGETLTFYDGDHIPTFYRPSGLIDHMPSPGIPIRHDLGDGRTVEATGAYQWGDDMIAIYGAGRRGPSPDDDAIIEKAFASTRVNVEAFGYLAYRCRVDAAERWGVQGTKDVGKTMAIRIANEVIDDYANWPPHEEACRLAADDEGMAKMGHHARLAVRISSNGIDYPGRDMLGHLRELAEATISGKADLMEQDPPPPLDGMAKAAKGGGPRR